MRDKLNVYAVLVEYWDTLHNKHIKKWHYVKVKCDLPRVSVQIEQIVGSVFEILEIEEC